MNEKNITELSKDSNTTVITNLKKSFDEFKARNKQKLDQLKQLVVDDENSRNNRT